MRWAISKVTRSITASVGRKALLGGAVAVAAAGSVGGGAYALTSSTSSPSSPSPAVMPRPHAPKGAQGNRSAQARSALVRRFVRIGEHAIHLEAVVPSKGGFLTLTLDRGVVTSASASAIVLKEANGQSVDDTVSSATRVLPRSLGGITGVHAGDHVVVAADNGAARFVLVPGARPSRVRGTVSSVSTTSITLTGPKGKTRQVAVTPSIKVLPASVGGITGVHDGEHVMIVEVAGNAKLLRVLGLRAPGTSSGTSASPSSGTPSGA
ncbi:MAG: hypothetical protein M1522_07350 [Actinobacteria bacterium]|nr:hypothetical protein [Actinomycetota bacterium]